jgi:hypothetical protein
MTRFDGVMVVMIHIAVFWIMTLCCLVDDTSVLEKHPASVFGVEGDQDNMIFETFHLSDYMVL